MIQDTEKKQEYNWALEKISPLWTEFIRLPVSLPPSPVLSQLELKASFCFLPPTDSKNFASLSKVNFNYDFKNGNENIS